MTTVLTVEDSRAVRKIITKQVSELGMEVLEAENGQEGLDVLQQQSVDLILLDVTMPVMDGIEMLKQLRASGNATPVIMLTAESGKNVLVDLMKTGITDYILKPFKPDELKGKIMKALRMNSAAPPPAASAGAASGPAVNGAKSFADVLVIDDMQNVHKKLRRLLPEHMTMIGCTDASSSLAECREKTFRVIMLDTIIPDVDSDVLLGQLRVLQPNAATVALVMRNQNAVEKDLLTKGYHGMLTKPFEALALEELLGRFFDSQEMLAAEDNVLSASKFSGRPERLPSYFTKLNDLVKVQLEKLADACYDEAILDLGSVPAEADKLPRLLLTAQSAAEDLGLELRVVGTDEIGKIMQSFDETSRIGLYMTVDDAQAA